jgi:excisionase family DNA binding protein
LNTHESPETTSSAAVSAERSSATATKRDHTVHAVQSRRRVVQPVSTASARTAGAVDISDRDVSDSGIGAPLLYTAEQAAALLQVRPSWLRRKAAARAVPCRFVGKHLRFSRTDIETIAENSAAPSRRLS